MEAELHVARFPKKKMNLQILTPKNSEKNHNCREYCDPPLLEF